MLGDLVHRHLRGVGHHDAQTRCFRHRDIVGPGAGAQDRTATAQKGEHVGRDQSRAAHRPDDVGVAGGFHDFGSARAFALHQLDPRLCELLGVPNRAWEEGRWRPERLSSLPSACAPEFSILLHDGIAQSLGYVDAEPAHRGQRESASKDGEDQIRSA